MFADKYVSTVSDIPDEPHWAIIKNRSVHIPGDERSRSNPGHGYPASTENYIAYEVYLTQKKWQQAIVQLDERDESYRALYVQTAQVERSVTAKW